MPLQRRTMWTVPLLSVVVGGRVVMLELRKASLASLATSLLSSLSSSISQMEGHTLKWAVIIPVLSCHLTWRGRGRHWDRRTSTPGTPWWPEWRSPRSRDRGWWGRGTSSTGPPSCSPLWWGISIESHWWCSLHTCTQQAVRDYQKCTWSASVLKCIKGAL